MRDFAMSDKAEHPTLHSADQIEQFYRSGLWDERNLVDYLDFNAARTPRKPAIVEQSRILSYGDLATMSENLAASLLSVGVTKGDVVAIQTPNWAELPLVHFAANRIGAIFLPLSIGFRERELVHLLRQSKAKVIFCPDAFGGFRYADQIDSLRPSARDLEQVVVVRGSSPSNRLSLEGMSSDASWRDEFGIAWLRGKRADPDSPSHVMVSSGSTGLPKCSLYSDNNTAVKLVRQYADVAGVGPADVAAALAPAGTGSTGYNFPILAILMLGGTSVLLEHWSGSRIDDALQLISANKCTFAVAVPAQLAKIVQTESLSDYDLRNLRFVTYAGAKLLPSIAQNVERALGCVVQSSYGTSEAGATTMTRTNDPTDKRLYSVGRPLNGQIVLIVDGEGNELPGGGTGEICWKGPNKSFGFLNDDDANMKVWDQNGLFHSGDLGRFDQQGYLHIAGRIKDVIIRGGQNVNPSAIEEILVTHPQVAEAAVVGVADNILGERIAACIALRGNDAPPLEALKALVRQAGLAHWNQPELLLVLRELPRNVGGKIDKKGLSQLVAERFALSDDSSVPTSIQH
jgi:non-ribosomal peptide synthetase component E (peptide arylation enzyme)